jgi:hypothetical protein
LTRRQITWTWPNGVPRYRQVRRSSQGGDHAPRSPSRSIPTSTARSVRSSSQSIRSPAKVGGPSLASLDGASVTKRQPGCVQTPVRHVRSSFLGGVGATTELIVPPQSHEECRDIAPSEQQPGFGVSPRRDDQPGRSDSDRVDLNPLDVPARSSNALPPHSLPPGTQCRP